MKTKLSIIFFILLSAIFVFAGEVDASIGAVGVAYNDPYDHYENCNWIDTGCTECHTWNWSSRYRICGGGNCSAGYTRYAYNFFVNSCTGVELCNNGGGLPAAGVRYTGTTYVCHYLDSIATWSECSGGVQTAQTGNWTTRDGSGGCWHTVATNRTCGVCAASAATTVFKNETEITDAYCSTGSVMNKSYDALSARWTWQCSTGNGSDPANCTGLNSFIDIGLRIKDDSAPGGVIVVGVEEETDYSPLKIYKNMEPAYTKKIWSIGLVPVTDADASKARIKVDAGERAIKKTIISCTPDCSNAPNVCVGDAFSDGCGGSCTGTKIGTCSGAATVCSGTQFNDSCGDLTCTGTMPGTCSNASSYNTDCFYANSCGAKTCTGSVVKTSQWYMNDRTNMSCNALCIANGWDVCLAIGINATAPFWSANTQRYIYSSTSYSPGTSVNTVITNDMKTWCNCYKNVLPCP